MIKFPGRLNLRPSIAQTAFVRVVTPRKNVSDELKSLLIERNVFIKLNCEQSLLCSKFLAKEGKAKKKNNNRSASPFRIFTLRSSARDFRQKRDCSQCVIKQSWWGL